MTKCGHFLNIVSYCLSVSFSNILAAVQRLKRALCFFRHRDVCAVFIRISQNKHLVSPIAYHCKYHNKTHSIRPKVLLFLHYCRSLVELSFSLVRIFRNITYFYHRI